MQMHASMILVFVSIVLTDGRYSNIADDSDLDPSLLDFIRQRFILDGYFPFHERNIREFTEEQRQFQKDSLEAHNVLRARHCAPPLKLDDEINERSQVFADELAGNATSLYHSTNRMGLFGENLYSLTRTSPITFADAFKATNSWYSEVSRYNYSDPGYRPGIAHFSQIVWQNSKKLGVGYAYALEGRKLYVVAQYSPPGNFGHAFAVNVLPETC